jgi:hypothetical protein
VAADTTDIAKILTLCDQLDAMLLGWLERSARRRPPGHLDLRATGVLALAAGALPELRRLCARWDLDIETRQNVALVTGPARVIEGLVAVTAIARRSR